MSVREAAHDVTNEMADDYSILEILWEHADQDAKGVIKGVYPVDKALMVNFHANWIFNLKRHFVNLRILKARLKLDFCDTWFVLWCLKLAGRALQIVHMQALILHRNILLTYMLKWSVLLKSIGIAEIVQKVSLLLRVNLGSILSLTRVREVEGHHILTAHLIGLELSHTISLWQERGREGLLLLKLFISLEGCDLHRMCLSG